MAVRRLAVAVVVVVASLLGVGTASAQAVDTRSVLDEAATELRRGPVYQHPAAERRLDDDALDALGERIAEGDTPIFVAVLPAAAAEEEGVDPTAVPASLGQATGLPGTYAVVVGNGFWAASNQLERGRAPALATAAFQARRDEGTEAVLSEFVDRVQAAGRGSAAPSGDGSLDDGGGGGGGGTGLLVLAALGGGGFLLWRRGRRRRDEEEQRRESAADRQMLAAELSVLADDVMALEPQVALHPEARDDYEAGVSRYRAGQAALEYAGDDVDFMRVGRVIAEGRYAMNRARARVEGREPPPPPEELRVPGRHDEPALDVDDRGRPVYVGAGEPFYGGGWFGGGGGGLFTGLLLGQMLGGGWGWGGGYGHHPGDDGGGDDGGDWGDDVGGGDWGGDFGGGDWGGGDFGGGDFGGGDWG
ncbi:MAG: hypothetical protein KY431_02730 [Actinobacteria bacterium]|nr:hypothetical protein [Actinomycetota bacterium]